MLERFWTRLFCLLLYGAAGSGSGRLLPEGGGRSASAAYRNIALRLIGRETPVMHLR